MSTNGALNRKLRMALVGGGQGAFIGRVHCTAAVLDNRAALVAGALVERSGQSQGLGPRLRHSARAGLRLVQRDDRRGAKLPADQRIDFVTVATPNHTHFPIAKAALEAGFNVVCDKPMTSTSNRPSNWRRSWTSRAWCSRVRTTTPAIPWCGRRAR